MAEVPYDKCLKMANEASTMSCRSELKWSLIFLLFVTFAVMCFLMQYPARTTPQESYKVASQRFDHPQMSSSSLPPLNTLQVNKQVTYSVQTKYVHLLHRQKLPYRNLKEALVDNASPKNQVFIALVDLEYVDMAMNLWETSFAPFGINNFLFIASFPQAYSMLQAAGLPVFLHSNQIDGGTSSSYGSQAFNTKTHIKTNVTLQALKYGFNVILTDVDIVYRKNPLPHFPCTNCDLQIQDDVVRINSGFYFVRKTPAAISLLEQCLQYGTQNKGKNDQDAMEVILAKMKKEQSIKFEVLNQEMFPNGLVFWGRTHHMTRVAPDNSTIPDSVVLIHNNFVTSAEIKMFRFKEFSMWQTDRNGYYSSQTARYIYYENIHSSEDGAEARELLALKNALAIGHILNRIVILPKFHCKLPWKGYSLGECILIHKINMIRFDQHFNTKYRENSFLKHNKVPDSVKKASPLVFSIVSNEMKNTSTDHGNRTLKTFSPKNKEKGATKEEIARWFKAYERWPVLHFHSLFNVFTFPLYGKDHELDISLEKCVRGPPEMYCYIS